MKKYFFLTLVMLLTWTSNVGANPVSKSEAVQKAAAFLRERGKNVSDNLVPVDGPRKAKAYQEAAPCYYVVNNGENDGFVIIAGDDRAKTVLAYADNGHFDEGQVPEMVAGILDGYAEEIANRADLDIEEEEAADFVGERAKTKTPTTNPVYPLLTSKWAQTEPFNNACPCLPTTTTRCYVGCVALAMGQLIYYYRSRMESKLPVSIPGYTCSTYWSDYKGYVKAPTIAAGTTINWNNMFDEENSSLTSTQISNVAKFLSYCAISIHSEFKGGSGAGTSAPIGNIFTALTKYFNFKSSNTDFHARSSYNYDTWKSKIINELKQDRPVLYYAIPKVGAGHVFLIDGFDGGDLFHINWGWGGKYDGYFSLTAFNPYDYGGNNSYVSTSSYLSSQKAFFDLQPVKGYNNVDPNTNLTATLNTASSASATVTYSNKTSNSGNYFFGLGYYDSNENIKLVKQSSATAKALASGGSAVVTYNLSISDFGVAKTTKKSFKVYPICKLKGEDDWRLCDQPSTVYLLNAECNGSVTLSIGKENADLSATNFTFPGSCVKGTEQPVFVTVSNTGGGDFFGSIYLFASKTTTMGSAKSYYQLYIPAGKSVDLRLYFTPGETGTYNVWAAAGSAGSPVLGKSTVKIVASSATRNLGVSTFSLQNVKSGYVVYGRSLRGTAAIKNSSSIVYNDNVIAQIYSWNGSTYKSTDIKLEVPVTIQAGKTYNLDFEFDDLSPSSTYAIVFKYADKKQLTTNSAFKGCKVTNAVMCYKATGEMKAIEPTATVTVGSEYTAVDFSGLTGTVTKVVPNSNPNTLYFIGTSETAASGLSGKNIVKGTVAEKIALTDGYAFYTPKDITAKSITYTRKSTLGTSGKNGWQTLIIPFSPTKVTCNGKELDWFRFAKDTQKDFWLKDFCAIEGASQVKFGYAQSMEANRPYLYAVPGNYWGEAYNLVGKSVVFSGQNAVLYEKPLTMTGSDVFNFRGSYMQQTLANTWVLDKTGAKFVAGTNAITPFHCYFIATDKDLVDVNELNIGTFEEETDGIFMPFAAEGETVDVYDLRGMKVGRVEVVAGKIDIEGLPKGVYVIKGKKMVKY